MSFSKNYVLIALLFFTGIIFFLFSGGGQAAEDGSEGLAVVLIIDNSNSMKRNDPDNVRIKAAQKVIELLGEDDQVGVVEFTSEAAVLAPLRQVGGEASRAELNTVLAAMTARGYTEMKGGLEAGYRELDKAEAGKKKLALMLSDGEPNLPSFENNPAARGPYLAEMDRVVEGYRTRGWAVHSIVLHEEAAGPVMEKIAETTGGEYFFVKEAAELTPVFHSLLVVHRHEEVVRPEISYEYEARTYKEGDLFPVRACLKVGDDCLILGPHLRLESFDLLAGYAGQEPQVIPLRDDGAAESADEKAGDGVYSALVECGQRGELILAIAARGTYRDNEFDERVELGSVRVRPETTFLQQQWLVLGQFTGGNWPYLAGAGAAVVLIMVLAVTVRRRKLRGQEKLRGTLLFQVEGSDNAANELIDLAGTGKSELLIASHRQEGINPDFFLPPLDRRHFAFKIKKFIKDRSDLTDIKEYNLVDSDIFYWAICLPGTFLVSGDLPKSRQQIFHGDRFEVGGYLFEFNCPEAKQS